VTVEQSSLHLAERDVPLSDIDPCSEDRPVATRTLTIEYPETLLLSLKESPETFAAEARLLLAVKLYELGKISTGTAATLTGMSRVAFMFALGRFGLSPLGIAPGELAEDLAHA
jgi:Uncharacterised protein family (UPF0175)